MDEIFFLDKNGHTNAIPCMVIKSHGILGTFPYVPFE
jgi:hypothetical protein